MKKKSKTKIYIIGFILLFVILYVYIYVVPRVSDIFTETYTAEYGNLESSISAECLLVRDETLYKAVSQGTVERVISQGKLMRKGSKIVTLSGTPCYTSERGIVSYFCDGMEDILTPDSLEDITVSALEKTYAEDFEVKECKTEAAAGEPIFKIVDNRTWYLCAWLAEDEAEGFVAGNTVTVDFNDGVCLKMKLVSITAEGSTSKLVMSCDRYYEFFDKYRTKECKLIRSDRSGILLETRSITEVDGQKGVYVKDKFGSYNFTPISILAQNDEITVVQQNYYYNADGQTVATVKNYEEILRNADKGEKESGENVD